MFTIGFGNRSITLPANPQAVSFGYNLNTVTTDTVAGKVVQILSTNVTDLTVSAKMGASDSTRGNTVDRYIELVMFCRDMMVYHANEKKPGTFTFPSLGYDLRVFLKNQSFTESFTQVSYPYTLNFMVDQDVSGVAETNAMRSEFAKIKAEVGYVPGVAGWHGGLE